MEQIQEQVSVTTRYRVECFDSEGKLKWVESFENLVTTLGLNALLDNTFSAPAAAVTWFVGLKGTGALAAGDTMASHAGWSELTPYSDATRPAWTKDGAASGGAMSNSASKASFSINASATVVGAFMVDDSTKGGTTGTLYGGGDFSASRSVVNGDTLNVQADPSITST